MLDRDFNGAEPPPPAAPLLPVAVGMIVGVAADDALRPAFWIWLAAFSIAAAAALSFRRRPVLRIAVLLVAAAAIGGMRHVVANRCFPADHIVFCVPDEPVLTRVRGRIVTVPHIETRDDARRLSYPQSPRTRFMLDAQSLGEPPDDRPICGSVAVVVYGALLTAAPGDLVEITGWLHRPRPPSNPGAYDWALHSRRAGLHAALSCSHEESVRTIARPAFGNWRGWFDTARLRLRRYVLEPAFAPDDPAAGVSAAMVLGERSAVSRAMNDAFIRTGNAHFLAASGMNVAWLALVGWGLLRLVGVYYRWAAVLVALLIVLYVGLAEPQPSMLRAGIMGVIYCLALFIRGRPNTVNALACSAIVILLADPADLFRPAFQFSFAGVAALIYVYPRLVQTLAAELADRGRLDLARYVDPSGAAADLFDLDRRPPSKRAAGPIHTMAWACRAGLKRLVQLGILSFSAWAAAAPLACYHFNLFTPWGWLGTMLLWFIALPATCVGFIMLFLGLLLPSTTVVMGPLLAWLTARMTGMVELLARVPGTVVDGRSPSTAWVVCTYAVLGVWLFRPQWLRRRWWLPAAATVLIGWWLIPPRWLRAQPGALLVWYLAVGDGSGTVIELPNGRTIIYDCGTRSPFDPGPMVVAFLRHRGIARIDEIIVSHADADHLNAIPTIAQQFPVGRIVVNDHFQTSCTSGSLGEQFLRTVRKLGVPVEVTHGRHVFDGTGAAQIESIWPPPIAEQRVTEVNETSTVLRVTHQGRSILLTGDIAEFAMSRLIAAGGIAADVLALPHHGGVVSNTAAFIRRVNPTVAIRSSGQSHRLTVNGIESEVGRRRYLNTADDGCVLIRIHGGEAAVSAPMQATTAQP